MGQYYLIVNLDKKQYLHPHYFGDGLKLLEFGCSGEGTMMGLAVLLANGNGRGGGDLDGSEQHPVVGSWAGDRIVIAGDYGDEGKWLENVPREELEEVAKNHYTEGHQQPEKVTVYAYAEDKFENISDNVLLALCEDQPVRDSLRERLHARIPGPTDHNGYWADSYPLMPGLAAKLSPEKKAKAKRVDNGKVPK